MRFSALQLLVEQLVASGGSGGGGSTITRVFAAADDAIVNDSPYDFINGDDDRLAFTLEEESLVRFYAHLQLWNPPLTSHAGLFLDDVQLTADDGQACEGVGGANAAENFALLPGANHMLGNAGASIGGSLARVLAPGEYEYQLKFYGNFGHAANRLLIAEVVAPVL